MDYAIICDRLGKRGARQFHDYETMRATWIDPTEAVPTQQECQTAWDSYVAEQATAQQTAQTASTNRSTLENRLIAAHTAIKNHLATPIPATAALRLERLEKGQELLGKAHLAEIRVMLNRLDTTD